MSSFGAQHPDEGQLLRYIDGELRPRPARQVERHIEACWQCRTALEDLKATVADCVRYRQTVAAHLPPAPAPWADLRREFDRIDGASKRTSGFQPVAPALRPWAIAAFSIAVLACGLYLKLRHTPPVEAAALLERAAAAADARPAGVRRIQVRTRTTSYTRTVGVKRAARAGEPEGNGFAARFAAARYDWDDPLSVRSFEDWRARLAAKQDVVSSGGGEYRIQTTTAETDLTTATLSLRETDLRPVEARMEFRDREWVEFTELADASTGDGGPPAVATVERPMRRAEPSRPAATSPVGSASISEELRVLAALHEMGADLGDPVEVTLAGGKVRVGGAGIAPERQRQIEKQVAAIPNVVVEFTAPAEAPAASAAAEAIPRNVPPSQAPIEKYLGGHADFERFSAYLLERSDTLMSRAYALRGLAQRFPASAEGRLGDSDRQVLRAIALEHAAAAGTELANMARFLDPVLKKMGASPLAAGPASAADWQSAAEDLFRASRRVEILLSQILGVSGNAGAAERLASDLLWAADEARADQALCDRLLR